MILFVDIFSLGNSISCFFNGYQDITPCKINITMPVYLVNGGVKQEILWKSISEEDQVSTSVSSSDCGNCQEKKW